MLSPDEHPGIFTFLVGIVVIVLVAVGLSSVIEKRFAFSSGGLRLERELALLDAEVASLRDRLDSATARWMEMDGPRARTVETLRKTEAESSGTFKRNEDLSAAADGLRAEIHQAEQAFLAYRADFRRSRRAAAVGEKISTFTLRDGRTYQGVTITKVTDVGLEIRHQHGFARIHAPDLGPDWQERFQWDDEERRTRLKEEALARERMGVGRGFAR